MKYPCDRREVMRLLVASAAGAAVLSRGTLSNAGTTDNSASVFVGPGQGQQGKIGANEITFKLDSSQTSGNLGSAEMLIQPGHLGAVPHYHTTFDEVVRVLEGTVTVLVGETTYDVPAGGWHLRRRGVMHSFWNAGTLPARSIEIYIPGGHEAFMKEITAVFQTNPRPEPKLMDEIGARYDVHFLWDKLPAMLEKYNLKL